MADLLDDYSNPIDLLLLTISECYVYKVPPLRTASGHRAEDWNLATPLFTGCLKVYQADTKLRVSVYTYKDPKKTVTTADNLNLFGECPVEVKPGDNIIAFVDSVIDSSRYYVLRIKDPNSNRTTMLGVGFREREVAFDFKNILNDYVRYVNRMNLASQMAALVVDDDLHHNSTLDIAADVFLSSSPSTPQHLAQHIAPLKEGEKIKIGSLGGKIKSHNTSFNSGSSASSSNLNQQHDDSGNANASSFDNSGGSATKSKGFLLKPPPPPGSTVFVSVPTLSSSPATASTTSSASDLASLNTEQQRDSLHSQTGSSSAVAATTAVTAVATEGDEEWGDFN